jgi:hypothetical protein
VGTVAGARLNRDSSLWTRLDPVESGPTPNVRQLEGDGNR